MKPTRRTRTTTCELRLSLLSPSAQADARRIGTAVRLTAAGSPCSGRNALRPPLGGTTGASTISLPADRIANILMIEGLVMEAIAATVVDAMVEDATMLGAETTVTIDAIRVAPLRVGTTATATGSTSVVAPSRPNARTGRGSETTGAPCRRLGPRTRGTGMGEEVRRKRGRGRTGARMIGRGGTTERGENLSKHLGFMLPSFRCAFA